MGKKLSPLELAARRVLDALHDDHEECHICLTSEELGHEPGSACAELEDALNAERAKRGEKRKASRVTVNKEQRLYVIPCGGGFTTLGFDYAEKQIAAVRAFRNLPRLNAATPGTLKHYAEYAREMEEGAAYAKNYGKTCTANLTPQLIGLEGKRVEVTHDHETRRFTVGKSTGWMPCHLELHNRAAHGGGAAYLHPEDEVSVIYQG